MHNSFIYTLFNRYKMFHPQVISTLVIPPAPTPSLQKKKKKKKKKKYESLWFFQSIIYKNEIQITGLLYKQMSHENFHVKKHLLHSSHSNTVVLSALFCRSGSCDFSNPTTFSRVFWSNYSVTLDFESACSE